MVNTSVETGIWQDYSYPGWQGSILTLDIHKSSILVSSLATFITLIGARAWALLAFIIHQLRASSKEKDGVHHQRKHSPAIQKSS
jgi:ABC-type Fe3+ transport system substrate-binding protein